MNEISSVKVQTPQVKVASKTEEKAPQENKSSMKTSTKVMIGAGLTALAAVGIYIATKGKTKPQTIIPETNIENNLSDLIKQRNELKSKISSDYNSRRHANLSDIAPNSFRRNVVFDNAASVKTRIQDCNKQIVENKKTVDEFSSQVRGKLSELRTDSDYQLCRKKDKRLSKLMDMNFKHDDSTFKEKETLIAQKFFMDAVIEAKINGESPLLKTLGLTVEDAMKPVKNPALIDDYMSCHHSKYKCDKMYKAFIDATNYGNMSGLFFFNGIAPARYSRSKLLELQKKSEAMEKLSIQKSQVLKNLADEFRNTDDVQKLKELNRQITELSK